MLDYRPQGGVIDEVHQEQSLEERVGKLRSLAEELGRASWISHDQGFHLRKNIEELVWGERREGLGDGVGTVEVRREVDAWRERRERS